MTDNDTRQIPSTPPRAKKIPHTVTAHGVELTDPYFWLRQKENPDVINILKEENQYLEAVLAEEKQLRHDLFDELKNRIKEDDSEVPVFFDGWYYYGRFEAGRQYKIHCRKPGSLEAPEQIILDENEISAGGKYFKLGVSEVSPDHQWLAYSVDLDGSEKFTVRFKNLETGVHSLEEIPGTSPSLEWAEDNRTVFYTLLDQHERPDRLMRHRLGTPNAQDVLIFKQDDPQLFVYCAKSKSGKFIFLQLYGKTTSEYQFLDAHRPEDPFQIIEPQRKGVLYSVTHHENMFYIVTNDEVVNFRIVATPVASPGHASWKEIRRGGPDLFIEGIEEFRNHLVVFERAKGIQQVRVIETSTFTDHTVSFSEPTYSLQPMWNPEYKTSMFRFTYTSMVTPATVLDYDMNARTREVKKVREVPGGYDPSLYATELIYAPANYAPTGHAAESITRTTEPGSVCNAASGGPSTPMIPISLVYKKGFIRDGSSPLYLYGYGSYGHSIPASFSSNRLSLLDRGFVFAIAHIRGGAELGRGWYDDGKFLKKKNTFHDFVSCAENLIREKYTSKQMIFICGGSAGGMLVGAVLNMRPELFRGAAAHVPFVDVVNTMLDSTLPLTVIEYEEWGDPGNKIFFDCMRSYSPYDNIEKKPYPHLLVTAGLNDPRVTYWEPLKWVQRLRELKTDNNLLLLHTHMEAGHGGSSGRFESLKDVALEYTFKCLSGCLRIT